jgi:hypothetical protein
MEDPSSVRRAFEDVVERIERGKGALVSAVPGRRSEGTPLAEALHAFESALRQARDGMEGWRTPEIEDSWQACSAGLEEAAQKAERLRLQAPSLDFEGLVMVLGNLIAPLDPFTEAVRRVR